METGIKDVLAYLFRCWTKTFLEPDMMQEQKVPILCLTHAP